MNRYFGGVVVAFGLALSAGNASATDFFTQAGRDLSNGLKTVGNVVVPPASPQPQPPSSPQPNRDPMTPCTVAPGACIQPK